MELLKRKSSEERERIRAERQARICLDVTRVLASDLEKRSNWGRKSKTVGYREGAYVEAIYGSEIDKSSESNKCEARYSRIGKGAVEVTCSKEDCPIADLLIERQQAEQSNTPLSRTSVETL